MNEYKKCCIELFTLDSQRYPCELQSYHNLDDIQVIEEVAKEVTFGEEVYSNKKLSFVWLNQAVQYAEWLKAA